MTQLSVGNRLRPGGDADDTRAWLRRAWTSRRVVVLEGSGIAPDDVPGSAEGRWQILSSGAEIDPAVDLVVTACPGALPPATLRAEVARLCAGAGAVLVLGQDEGGQPTSPAGDDFASHLATLFAEKGFFGEPPPDGEALPAGTVLYRDLRLPKEAARPQGVLTSIDRALFELRDQKADAVARYEAAVAEHDRLAERFNALAGDHRALEQGTAALRADVARLTRERDSALLRRQAEAAAEAAHLAQLEARFTAVARELDDAQAATRSVQSELSALEATKLLRYSRRLRRLYGHLRAAGRRRPSLAPLAPGAPSGGPSREATYELWVQLFDTMDETRRAAVAGRVAQLASAPLVSVVMPVYETPAGLLRRAIDSIRSQIYENWELCIADDGSHDPAVAEVLAAAEGADPRIRVVRRARNGHIAAASNSALEVASGEWIVPVDHDDELPAHALAMAVLAAADRPDATVVYSDEDKIDAAGNRYEPYFKPDFDPVLLLGQNYLCHMTMMRADLVRQVGGYREGTEGSQDWDLVLRLSEVVDPASVVHVPHVLYHWRGHPASTASDVTAKPYAVRAGTQAVRDHVARTGRQGEVITNGATGLVRVKWRLPATTPKVSIVIPTRDGPFLERCIESVLGGTGYANYEVVVVDNGSRSRSTLAFLRRIESCATVVRDERPFNYPALNNGALAHCTGEVICLLNDDCIATHYDWLEEMVSQLFQDGVGAVGAKLLYGDGRIQHGGVILGIGSVAGHAHRFDDPLTPGHFGRMQMAQSLSAVTAACMVVRREVYEEVGGLDEVNLPVAFNDVDFCLRIGEAGWRIVWTPFAELTHHESVTRGPDTGVRAEEFGREISYMTTRWGHVLRRDPAYNPNLTLEHEDFGLAFPPRVTW